MLKYIIGGIVIVAATWRQAVAQYHEFTAR
jgi:hypothetical protein